MLASLLTAPLALVHPLPVGNHLWLTDSAVIAGASAAVAFRTRGGWAFLVVLLATVFWLAFVVTSGPRFGDPFASALLATFYVTLIVALAIATRRAGDQLDLVRAKAVAEATTAAVNEARRIERSRIESLVHDSVIVALLTYAQNGDGDAAAAEADKALRDIEQFDSIESPATDREPQRFVWELQALTTEVSADIRFSYKLAGGLAVPADVASAVIAATSEALRNSLRHAGGADVAREVHAEISDAGIAVTVLDAGCGFNPDSVSPARLGISAGIVGRMARIPGGSSLVSSTRGRGTTIAIRWVRS
jgi:signal transduction histidine kinase